jgi:chromosome partitioning protein
MSPAEIGNLPFPRVAGRGAPRGETGACMTDATAESGAQPDTIRQTDSYVITVANQKGGVGKTMLTLSLAATTAAAHGRALVVDVDPQANAYDLTRLMEDPGYDVIHELNPDGLAKIRKLRNYDTIIVDCPGSLEGGDVLARVLQASSYVVIPYDHELESVGPTLRTVDRVKASGVPYGVVLTKADPHRGGDMVLDAWETLEQSGARHFRSFIRLYRAWPNSLKAGIPISRYSERHAPKIREDISSLYTEMLLDLGRQGRR